MVTKWKQKISYQQKSPQLFSSSGFFVEIKLFLKYNF
nr:MAG TPA: hypothetical protein [Caudoviricetes sp.]